MDRRLAPRRPRRLPARLPAVALALLLALAPGSLPPAAGAGLGSADPSPSPSVTTFATPLYLLWMDRHGTLDGPVVDNTYWLWTQDMDADGHVAVADGTGGVFHYEGRHVAGPLLDSSQACAAMAAVGVVSLTVPGTSLVVDCTTQAPSPVPSPTSATATGAGPTPSWTGAQIPLCPEVRALGEGRWAAPSGTVSRTGLHVGKEELSAQFRDAVERYDAAHPGAGAYVTDTVLGEVGAAAWLSVKGGIPPSSSAYVTGKERALYDAVLAAVRQRRTAGADEPRLTPGEVFELALNATGGAAPDALLAAHNVLRSQARFDADAAAVPLYDSGFVSANLVPLRDGENGGPWYHLFGTAYFEMKTKGDWGLTAVTGVGAWTVVQYGAYAVGAAASAPVSGPAWLALGGLAYLLQRTGSVSETSGLSRVANGFEQWLRTSAMAADNHVADAEKFCLNIWGAQIGRELYDLLPGRTARALRGLLSELPQPSDLDASPAGAGTLVPLTAPDGGWTQDSRYVTVVGSPYSMWFDAGSQTMLLDQVGPPESARLVGHIDGLVVVPVYEAESASWGVAFSGAATALQRIVFEAAADAAPLHVWRVDLATGTTAAYTQTVPRRGQVLFELVGDRTLGSMSDTVGNPVTPVVTTDTPVTPADAATWITAVIPAEPQSAPLAGTDGPTAPGLTWPPGWVAIVAVVIVAVLVLGVLLARRRSAGGARAS